MPVRRSSRIPSLSIDEPVASEHNVFLDPEPAVLWTGQQPYDTCALGEAERAAHALSAVARHHGQPPGNSRHTATSIEPTGCNSKR